jgi:hypothetical protein
MQGSIIERCSMAPCATEFSKTPQYAAANGQMLCNDHTIAQFHSANEFGEPVLSLLKKITAKG